MEGEEDGIPVDLPIRPIRLRATRRQAKGLGAVEQRASPARTGPDGPDPSAAQRRVLHDGTVRRTEAIRPVPRGPPARLRHDLGAVRAAVPGHRDAEVEGSAGEAGRGHQLPCGPVGSGGARGGVPVWQRDRDEWQGDQGHCQGVVAAKPDAPQVHDEGGMEGICQGARYDV